LVVPVSILDAPKRSKLKNVPSHTSKDGCDRCHVHIEPKEDYDLKHVCYPADTMGRRLKSNRWITHVRENWDDLNEVNRRGVYQEESPLAALNGFDVISGVPAEYMHSVCEGLVKAFLR
jgi:hypothetical protein